MTFLVAAILLGAACALWVVVDRASRPPGAPEDARGGCGACSGRATGKTEAARRTAAAARVGRRLGQRAREAAPLLVIAVAASAHGACAPGGEARALVRETRPAMGTAFTIQAVAAERGEAAAAIDAAFAEIERLEALLSEWRGDSEISRVNREAAGRPVPVGPELLEVVERSLAISDLTDGAFDITVAACSEAWSMDRSALPGEDEIEACRAHIGWRHVELDPAASTIRFARAGTLIGISGIGKGYGVDAAARVLEAHGISDYLVDGGGDIRLRGRGADGPWRVGVADPRAKGRLFAELELSGGAVVTSGDYVQFFERNGVRYHHILDPATGRPARRSIAVTVLAGDATEADAFATGLFVLGPERGVALAESLPGVEALIHSASGVPRATAGFPRPRR